MLLFLLKLIFVRKFVVVLFWLNLVNLKGVVNCVVEFKLNDKVWLIFVLFRLIGLVLLFSGLVIIGWLLFKFDKVLLLLKCMVCFMWFVGFVVLLLIMLIGFLLVLLVMV